MSPTTQAEGFACRHTAESTRFEDAQEAHPLSRKASTIGKKGHGFRAGVGLENVARRTLGLIMLLTTVLLWTTSNFLASYIFADNTYSKPYFVTYLNASFFALSLPAILLRRGYQEGLHKSWLTSFHERRRLRQRYGHNFGGVGEDHNRGHEDGESHSPLLAEGGRSSNHFPSELIVEEDTETKEETLNVLETAWISFEFSMLWFLANYFVAACLEYTSVASSTILTSTSSIFTLIFGAIFHVESFTTKKLVGVLASFTGIILISMVDLSGDNDDRRGSFPHKSQRQLAIGDILAFLSAVMYGVYAVVMKKRVGNEDRVNMPLFFGFVGLFNLVFLWPGFFVLHFAGVETFELPPTGKIWMVVLLNSAASFVSDYCWAYAMLLTTPLIVSVGLSLTIPISLIGQIILSSQSASLLYWAGAAVVVLSFLFINHESYDIGEETTSP